MKDKTKLGKFAYDLSAVNNLISMETFPFRVLLDGAEEDIETSTILIGLTNSIGGVETIFPEANVNDGFLNFLSIKDKNLLDTIKGRP
ncbi:MAG: diacylglycerol/lipid kinase family protein [Enterocloster bolteae]